MRIIGIAAAGALAALAALAVGGPALAHAPTPAPEALTPEPPAPATTGRAHLVFRTDDEGPAIVGRMTVVERRTDTVVYEEISSSCAENCSHRRLARMAPAAPLPPLRE